MNAKELETSIKAKRKHLEQRKRGAIKSINDGFWLAAQCAINDCIADEATIKELEFQLECLEVE